MKYRIGFLIDWIDSPYHFPIIEGVISAANKNNCNLLIFSGGALKADEKWESVRNDIFNFVKKEVVDGIILASGALNRYCGSEYFHEFCRKFKNIPLLSINEDVAFGHSIQIDNEIGYQALINHLIHEHGYSRLAFIAGPEGNSDAGKRFDVYKKVLAENSIPYDASLVARGNFLDASGKQAVVDWIESNNINFNAIVACNDNMAIGAIRGLQEFGIKVPEDIAVIGFDDLVRGRIISPALSTVKHPLYELGQKSIKLICAILDGNQLETTSFLPTSVVIRESCGCKKKIIDFIKKDNSPGEDHEICGNMDSFITRSTNRIVEVLQDEDIKPGIIKSIVDSFFNALDGKKTWVELEFINNFVLPLFLRNSSNKIFENILYILKDEVTKTGIPEKVAAGFNLLMNIQSRIIAVYERNTQKQNIMNRGLFAWYRNFAYKALEDPDLDEFIKVLGDHIPGAEIKSMFCILFEDTKNCFSTNAQSKILLAWDNEKGFYDRHSPFPSWKILPDDMFPGNRQYSILIEPLYFKDNQFGMALFELFEEQYSFFINRMYLVNALNAFIIIKQLQEVVRTLQSTQQDLIDSEKMAALGKVVAGVAHEINTPVGVSLTSASFLQSIIKKLKISFNANKLKKSALKEYISLASDSARIIQSSLQRTAELVSSLKTIAVDQSVENCRKFNVKSYIQDVLLSIRPKFKKTDHKIMVECPPDIEIENFPGSLAQILTNLLMNSLIHGFEGVDAGLITINVELTNDWLNILYRDNGRGIAVKYLKQIFEPFFTTKRNRGGTGLGLHMVYKIVTEKLHGTIQCHSKPGEGVAFVIAFPVE